MTIRRGTPSTPGFYAVYFMLSKNPETVRYWNGAHWQPNPIEHTLSRGNFVHGFVGPLPSEMEFDL